MLPRYPVCRGAWRAVAFLFIVSAVPVVAFAAASYQRLQLSDLFFSEGAAFGDFNRDGQLDVVSGPYWYSGPEFKTRHEIYPAGAFDPLRYSDNFFAFAHDFNRDGWDDILVLGFPGVDASWYENPGEKPLPWRRKVVFLPVDNESPTFADIFGTGQPVLLCTSHGRIGYASYDPKDPGRPWVWTPISAPGPWQRYTHGLGYGDVNGDGRVDLLAKSGWWEQPESLKGNPVWKHHPFTFGPPTARGGAQMYTLDVNGDGFNDVVTALDAHGYGISWFEQLRDPMGAISFREHRITSFNPEEKIRGVQFSQPHALLMVDVNGDSLPDFVSGKRWWAHGPKGDADPNGTPVLYAFLLRRDKDSGRSWFEPQLIDSESGVGTQLSQADVNRDGLPDFVVGNKRGTFLFLSQRSGSTP